MINIWGKEGCELPEGAYCDSCCQVKTIDDEKWGKNGFHKKAFTPCVFMARLSKMGRGCSIHQMAPNSCENYHCSDENPRIKLELIEYTRTQNLITEKQAHEAVKRIIEASEKN